MANASAWLFGGLPFLSIEEGPPEPANLDQKGPITLYEQNGSKVFDMVRPFNTFGGKILQVINQSVDEGPITLRVTRVDVVQFGKMPNKKRVQNVEPM